MVLKSSIHTSALPRRQRSDRGLRVTQDAHFSLLIHIKQLLLLTLCDMTAGSENSKGFSVVFFTVHFPENLTNKYKSNLLVDLSTKDKEFINF